VRIKQNFKDKASLKMNLQEFETKMTEKHKYAAYEAIIKIILSLILKKIMAFNSLR